jgi:hypothetical protein
LGSKPCQDQFLYRILVHCKKNKKNTGSQIGHTKKTKNTFKLIIIFQLKRYDSDVTLTSEIARTPKISLTSREDNQSRSKLFDIFLDYVFLFFFLYLCHCIIN